VALFPSLLLYGPLDNQTAGDFHTHERSYLGPVYVTGVCLPLSFYNTFVLVCDELSFLFFWKTLGHPPSKYNS